MTSTTIFDSKVLDSLTRDILAKILINYANNIGCWLLKDDSLAIVQKEEFEEYVKQDQHGVKALFIKLIIAMQDQIMKANIWLAQNMQNPRQLKRRLQN